MEHVGAEGYERWERGVGCGEGDLESQDCGGVGTCFPLVSWLVLTKRREKSKGRMGTLSYEDYAGPEGGVAGCEAHEYTMRTGELETRAVRGG